MIANNISIYNNFQSIKNNNSSCLKNKTHLVCYVFVCLELRSCPISQIFPIFLFRYIFNCPHYLKIQGDYLSIDHELKRKFLFKLLAPVKYFFLLKKPYLLQIHWLRQFAHCCNLFQKLFSIIIIYSIAPENNYNINIILVKNTSCYLF